MPLKEIHDIAESLNFKWVDGAFRLKLSNGVENEIHKGVFERFHNLGKREGKKEFIEKLFYELKPLCGPCESKVMDFLNSELKELKQKNIYSRYR